jgi:phosphoribosyl 1,2-cyclic phosphodiesterase
MDETAKVREPMTLRFWGVRGSTPTAVAANLGYGGNTPCASVMTETDELLIFDAGSGLRALGAELMRLEKMPRKLHLFCTHFHWDHLQGLPFFAPLYRKETELAIYSAHDPEELHEILGLQMGAPYFPVEFDEVPSQVELWQIGSKGVKVGGVKVEGFPLNHPQGAQGYRITGVGKTIVFATDHEHGDEEIDANLLEVARGADVLIYDAQYTADEYASRAGWGHGTWVAAVEVAAAAGVGKLVLFHHDPEHDDAAIDAIVAVARERFAETVAAREGMAV